MSLNLLVYIVFESNKIVRNHVLKICLLLLLNNLHNFLKLIDFLLLLQVELHALVHNRILVLDTYEKIGNGELEFGLVLLCLSLEVGLVHKFGDGFLSCEHVGRHLSARLHKLRL